MHPILKKNEGRVGQLSEFRKKAMLTYETIAKDWQFDCPHISRKKPQSTQKHLSWENEKSPSGVKCKRGKRCRDIGATLYKTFPEIFPGYFE